MVAIIFQSHLVIGLAEKFTGIEKSQNLVHLTDCVDESISSLSSRILFFSLQTKSLALDRLEKTVLEQRFSKKPMCLNLELLTMQDACYQCV